MIPQSGPCFKRVDGNLQEAPYCVVGLDPDRRGGGVLYWAWDAEEASLVADAYRSNGYHDVNIRDAISEETKKEVTDIVVGLLGK